MTYLPANLFAEREGRKQDPRPKETETVTLPPAPPPPAPLPVPPPQPTWVEQPLPREVVREVVREIVIERPPEPTLPPPPPKPIVIVAPTPATPSPEPTVTTPKPEEPRPSKKNKMWQSWKRKNTEDQAPRYVIGVALAGLALLLVLWGMLNIFPKANSFPEKHLRAEHLVPKLKVKQDRVAKSTQPLIPVAQHPPFGPVITPIVPVRPAVQPPAFPPAPPFKEMKPHLKPPELKPDNPPIIPAMRYQVARDPLTDNDYKVFLQREVAPMYNPLKPSVSSLVLAALMAGTLEAQIPGPDVAELKKRVEALEAAVANIKPEIKQDLKALETSLSGQIAKIVIPPAAPPADNKNDLAILQIMERLNKLDNKLDKELADLRKMNTAPPALPPIAPPPDATADVRKIIDQLKELTTAVNALRPQEKISLFPPTTNNKPEPKDNFEFFNAFDEDLLITINSEEPRRVRQGSVLRTTVPVGVVTFQVRTPSGWVGQPNSVTLAEGQKYTLGAKVPPGR